MCCQSFQHNKHTSCIRNHNCMDSHGVKQILLGMKIPELEGDGKLISEEVVSKTSDVDITC